MNGSKTLPTNLPNCPPPLPPAPARFNPPPGACDCHFHVFGPFQRFPLAVRRSYTPPEASVAAYRTLMHTIGIDRCVIVQPSVYQTDNSCTLAAARALGGPERCRVVAVIDAEITRPQLNAMHVAGVRGVRINTVAGGGPNAKQMCDIAQLIAPLGWHLQLFMPLEIIADNEHLLATLPVQVVLDHMAAPGNAASSHRHIPALLRMLERGHTWTKLSGAYLSSNQDAPWDDMGRLARLLTGHRPDRLVWGTNWPHPSRFAQMPGDNEILDALSSWVPDALLLKYILATNPSALYGFDEEVSYGP